MPTVSRAIAVQYDAGLAAEVCSAGGEHPDPALMPAHHDDEPAKPGLHLDHCGFCLTHAGSFGLLPSDAIVALPAPAAPALAPVLFLRAPRPLHAWAAPPSRAPPRYA